MSTEKDEKPVSEYEPGERTLNEIMADLRRPIPPRLLKKKTVKGTDIYFIPWYRAIKFLDLYAPGWKYEVKFVVEIGKKLVLVTRISIPVKGPDGDIEWIYREATGQEDEDTSSWGDSSSNAESMALRRTAAKFGLGLDLYENKPDGTPHDAGQRRPPAQQQRQAPPPQNRGDAYEPPEDETEEPPRRRTDSAGQSRGTSERHGASGELISPKQVSYANSLARELGKAMPDLLEECFGEDGPSEVEDLSKRQATKFIDFLKDYEPF